MSKKLPIFLGLLFLGLFVWLMLTPNYSVRYVLKRLDYTFYDMELRIHLWAHPTKTRGPIAIVDIDDASLKEIGRWPWPRSVLANLLNTLKQQGAKVIATDMMFSEADVNIVQTVLKTLDTKQLATPQLITTLNKIIPSFEQDGLFAESLQQLETVLGMVFLPTAQQQGALPVPLFDLTPLQAKELSIFKAKGYISNIPVLEKVSKGFGFLNAFPDEDGIVRRSPLVMRFGDGIYPSLALQAVRQYLSLPEVRLKTPYYGKSMRLEGIQAGHSLIPTDERGQVLIPFIGKSFSFPYFSAVKVLRGQIPTQALAGKLVFIGTSATGISDIKPTAAEKVFPGVEVQATIANGLFTNYFPYTPPWAKGAELLLTIVVGLLGAFIFPYLGPLMVSVLMLSVPLAFVSFLFGQEWVWYKTGLVISTIIPMALLIVLALFNIIYGYLFEARKRKRLHRMFGQYVPKKHIDAMLKTKSSFGLLGEDREMTVLFADIRNFTTISEGMSAPELKELLNFFFTPMTEIIFKHRGTIDKYMGDLIMAFWGAPLKDKGHIQHALGTALDMQAKIKQLAPELSKRGWPKMQMGIGLNSGLMSVGDMGSKFRRNYTVLGNEVNIASRVESLTKFYNVAIITTEHACSEQQNFIFKLLDRVRVKGKQEVINIYEVLGRAKELTPALQQELKAHEEALAFYFNKQFQEADVLFNRLHEMYPQCRLYEIYLERLSFYKEHPPLADWDGVYTHATK